MNALSRISRSPYNHPLLPEIWLHVFPHLPTESLPDITLTCRDFLWLAQPLMFSRVVFHPFLMHRGSGQISKPEDLIRRNSDLLKFWASARIAPAIHVCTVAPSMKYVFSMSSDCRPTTEAVIDDDLFSTLLRLPNLKHLSFRFGRFPPRQLEKLCQLKLTSLTLNTCLITNPSSISKLALQVAQATFICNRANGMPRESNENKGWLSLFDNRRLEELLIADVESAQILIQDQASLASFESLRVLSTCSSEFIPLLSLLLPKCHGLEELTIRPPVPYCFIKENSSLNQRIQIASLPSCSELAWVPRLQSYQGPHEFMPFVAQGGSLREVKLWSLNTGDYCDLKQLLCSLDLAREIPKLETFDASFCTIPHSPFLSLLSIISNVKTLCLNIRPLLERTTLRTNVPPLPQPELHNTLSV